MLQAAQLNVQLLHVQCSHLFGTRREEGRLAPIDAVFPTPEARIGQHEVLAETLVRPAHLSLQSAQRRDNHFGRLILFFYPAAPTTDGSAPSAPGLRASPAAPGSGVARPHS